MAIYFIPYNNNDERVIETWSCLQLVKSLKSFTADNLPMIPEQIHIKIHSAHSHFIWLIINQSINEMVGNNQGLDIRGMTAL